MKLYTTGCPQCNVLKKKLDDGNFRYEIIDDIEVMQRIGVVNVPTLEVDGARMNFYQSINWIKESKK